MKKLFVYLVFIILILWVLILNYVIIKNDVSLVSAHSKFLEESRQQHLYSPPTVLISYADGSEVFFANQASLAQSALGKGIDHIMMYRKNHMSNDFVIKNNKILSQDFGAGFWVWKPYFILKTMEEWPDNTIIFYADSGIIFTMPQDHIIAEMDHHDVIFVSAFNDVSLKHDFKEDARKFLRINDKEDILNSIAVWGCFMVFKNNEFTKNLVKNWLRLCENSVDFAGIDQYSSNDKQFINPSITHYDQALLSVVTAKLNSTEHKKIKFIKKPILRKEYGVDNFHRHEENRYSSPQFRNAGIKKSISDILFDNVIMQKIREIITVRVQGYEN